MGIEEEELKKRRQWQKEEEMSRALQWKEFQNGVKEQLDKMQLKSQEQEILTRSGRIFTFFWRISGSIQN